MRISVSLLTLVCLLTLMGCKKDKTTTLEELYKTYKSGQIAECQHNGELVYSAALNAYDAGGVIYDADGHQIGVCIYAVGNVDPICLELDSCEMVYMVEGNIWGQPAVDTYGLGD